MPGNVVVKNSNHLVKELALVHHLNTGLETWGFPVLKLGSTRLPVMVYKSVLTKGYPMGVVK